LVAALLLAPPSASSPDDQTVGEGPASGAEPQLDRGQWQLRLGVGISTTALGAALWAAGGVAVQRGIQRRTWCDANTIMLDDGSRDRPLGCLIDAPGMAFASGALSLAFALPATIVGIIVTERAARGLRRSRRAQLSGGPQGLTLHF
jgi:hypothetical protein